MSFVHLIGFKVPMLYIYFNVPSTRYQDQIISFLAFGWAMFFLAVSYNLNMIKYLLTAGLVAVLALVNINLTNDFRAMADVSSWPFWLQTVVLAIYAAWLLFFSFKAKR
ncbi:MAG TPA: hypothetical protein ENK21_08130 [Trueperaceae bacterium]|nr:hypothetical protein [Trueperaceae bacterium]